MVLRSTSDSGKATATRDAPLEPLRLYLLVALTINLTVFVLGAGQAFGLGSVLGFSGSILLAQAPFLLMALLAGAGLILTTTRQADRLLIASRGLMKSLSSLGVFNGILFAALILFFGVYHLAGWDFAWIDYFPPIWIFGHLGLLGALFLSGTRKITPSSSLLVTFSVYGLLLWVIKFIPEVHAYPLSLGWSETSRYYYASLFFSPLVYGKWVPLSSLHPTRYLMQSLPFLIPSLGIEFHRLWQVLLWLITTLVAGVSLTMRIRPQDRWVGWALTAWFFMFSFQGPVYYHLMVVVILVLFGFDSHKPWRSFVVVALASLWSGISRVNWFPVAGMLAVTLYVLEVPQGEKSFWQYWRLPVFAVVLGLLIAFGAQSGYAILSGNPPEVFASSFNSPLYRYRLFPNEAYGPGIINLTVTASFPLLLIILWRILPRLKAWHFLRLLALLSILIALLVAGFIVSTKIGGGDNLHNMDSFLVTLAVIAAYCGFNRFEPDRKDQRLNQAVPKPLVVMAMLIPLIFAVDLLLPYPRLDTARAWADIQQVQDLIDARVPEDGEVLFIQNRHLLTFDLIKGVDLIPEYEKVFLMEMAMSGNQNYLHQFWEDLETHRFDLIVTEPIAIVTRPSSDVFGEENNAWVENVSLPLLEWYQPLLDLTESGMTILAPKDAQ